MRESRRNFQWLFSHLGPILIAIRFQSWALLVYSYIDFCLDFDAYYDVLYYTFELPNILVENAVLICLSNIIKYYMECTELVNPVHVR